VDHAFKINLRGIIDLLSHHLYSSPQVYLRELLQNGVDAIRARQKIEPGRRGEIRIEVIEPRGGSLPTLAFVDDGIGLTENEVHRFLSTIGESSKRGAPGDPEQPRDFLGQFGIGLLSCFVVSDEIVVLTRSARPSETPGETTRTIEWRGRPDGTYTVRALDQTIPAGTQVYLTCKKGSEEYFAPEQVRSWARRYGGLLPYPINFTAGKDSQDINERGAPWRRRYDSESERTRALLDYGKEAFGIDFFDAIPLQSSSAGMDGAAFVLPFPPGPSIRQPHRVYLKNMLVSENVEEIAPDWAFFVRCIINTDRLRPTASRESFVEDESLEDVREAVGETLRDYLIGLAKRDPKRLRRLIDLHALTVRALALHDDEFYRLFADWLDFETSQGVMTLGEYRRRNEVVRFVPDLDRFRQIAGVARAQGLCIINAAYTYEAELLMKLPQVFPEALVELVEPIELAHKLDDPTQEQGEEVIDLLIMAEEVLAPFRCEVEIKSYAPESVPALYSIDPEAGLRRALGESKEMADPLWSSVLGELTQNTPEVPQAKLFLNYRNPLIRKMARVRDRGLLRRSVEMLYIQSLLLGHHPLGVKELALLNEGLIGLIEWGVAATGGNNDGRRAGESRT
jgi:molecular chaperone HtpG